MRCYDEAKRASDEDGGGGVVCVQAWLRCQFEAQLWALYREKYSHARHDLD